jgi:hypothetical protein
MTEATVETLWDRQGATPYQTRVKCGPFRIHIFWRGDRDPDMHDHPADFWTFPLVSYVEEYRRNDGGVAFRIVKAFRPHRRRAELSHRVWGRATGCGYQTGDGPVVTLGWWGKKRREWGFHTPAGWVPWKVYVKEPGWDRATTVQPDSASTDAAA